MDNKLTNAQQTLWKALNELAVNGEVVMDYDKVSSKTGLPVGTIGATVAHLRNVGLLHLVGKNPEDRRQNIYRIGRRDLDEIIEFYAVRIEEPSMEAIEGLNEYWKMLEERGIDAYKWLHEAIAITAKKHPDKQNFPYMVGMIRNWLNYGFGNIPSDEERELLAQVQIKLGDYPLSPEARNVFYRMMGTHGCIKTLVALFNTPLPEVDMSLMLAVAVEHALQSQETATVEE